MYAEDKKCELLHGLTHGFRLHYEGPDRQRTSINHKSARDNIDIVKLKLDKELAAGRIAGPFDKAPFQNFQIPSLGLAPKKAPGQIRIIHDLSYPKGDSINSAVMK